MANKMVSEEMEIFWLIGITLSAICLILQILLFIFVPRSRELDLKILTQMTIARLVNVTSEYIMLNFRLKRRTQFIAYMIYTHSDCALVCWMFLFTKNLYDKVIKVFATKNITFVWKSVLVWLLTLPVGILHPVLQILSTDEHNKNVHIFYKVYSISKFVILSVNLLFFTRIFYVVIKRKISDNLKGVLRTCIISLILVTISSLQVLLTDLVSYFDENLVTLVFCVINSYQILAVMVIFVNLVRGFSGESLQKTISKAFSSSTD